MRISRLLQDDGEIPLQRHIQAALFGFGGLLLGLWYYAACETSYSIPEVPPYSLPVRIDYGQRTPEMRLLVSPDGVEAESLDGSFLAGWQELDWLEQRLRASKRQHPAWWIRIDGTEDARWQDLVNVIGILERMSNTHYGLN